MLDETHEFLRKIEEIAERDGRYRNEAYLFIYAALEYTVRKLKRDRSQTPESRHVTGQELSGCIADYAREQYGPITRAVFEYWGIRETLDFGRIVFNLVDAGMMGKRAEDSLEDFREVYDFDETFDPKRIQSTPGRLDLEHL